jgi:hypothetical protein
LEVTYDIPDGIDDYTKAFLQHLKRPKQLCGLKEHPLTLPVEIYRDFWRKAREHTACYPGELSFATLKAGAQDDIISEFKCIMMRIPIFAGFSPKRWKKCLDVMILKKEGLIHVDSLMTIGLFQPDCNYAFKFLGRKMMKHAETHQTIAAEQFGSRCLHRAIDLAVNKVLTNDLLRQTKSPEAICANNAKLCYDLIVHPSAVLAMRRQGVPEAATTCLFNMLQEARHQVRTAFGDSVTHFGGGNEVVPMHSICQGNGAGLPIWAVVSTPILDMLRTHNLGSFICTAISKWSIRCCSFSFVDDTDTIQTARSDKETWQDIVREVQKSLDYWEGGLASGAAIVLSKTSWNMTSFKWNNGVWKYQSIEETPATLDIDQQVHTLRRLEHHESIMTLKVEIAPDGNMVGPVEKLLQKSSVWSNQIKQDKLSIIDSWIALTSTLWRSLA